MRNYLIITKKRTFVIISLAICLIFIAFETSAISNADKNAKTNTDRLIFIENLGYTVIDSKPQAKTVNIPDVFYDVYERYNALQQKANYDLSLYKGCKVVIYTYAVLPPQNYSGECVVNLIVYKNKVIGGDVSSVALGGFMLPLK